MVRTGENEGGERRQKRRCTLRTNHISRCLWCITVRFLSKHTNPGRIQWLCLRYWFSAWFFLAFLSIGTRSRMNTTVVSSLLVHCVIVSSVSRRRWFSRKLIFCSFYCSYNRRRTNTADTLPTTWSPYNVCLDIVSTFLQHKAFSHKHTRKLSPSVAAKGLTPV